MELNFENLFGWHIVNKETFMTSEPNADHIYFIEDTGEIYRGAVPFGKNLEFCDEFPTEKIVINCLYIKNDTHEAKIFNGTEWIELVTAGGTDTGVKVTNIEYDPVEKILTVHKSTDENGNHTNIILNGLATGATYNAETRILQLVDQAGNDVGDPITIPADNYAAGGTAVTAGAGITVENGKVSLENVGVKYYKYVPATEATETTEATEASYVLTEGWKDGLVARIETTAPTEEGGETTYTLVWYEQPTTIDKLDKDLNALVEFVNSVSADLATEVTRAQTAEEALATRISTNTSDLTTLKGDASTEGSVANTVAKVIAALTENPDETKATLQSLVDWVNNNAQDALTLTNNVASNTQAIEALESLVGTLPEDAISTNLVDYIGEVLEKVSSFDVDGYVAKTDIVTSATLATTVEAASDEKVVSEKVVVQTNDAIAKLVEALTWKTTM